MVQRNGVDLLDVFNHTPPEDHVTLTGNQFNWMKLDFLLKLRHPAFLGNPTKVKFLSGRKKLRR